MAGQGLLPRVFARVHERRRTPHVAAIVLLAVLLPPALLGSVANLASASVLLLLVVFAVVNGALFILKGRVSQPTGGWGHWGRAVKFMALGISPPPHRAAAARSRSR